MSETKAKKRPRATNLEGVPRLMTHREVAQHFRVSSAGLRRWVEKGQFPLPHSRIAQTLYYREATISHRLLTGDWPDGVEFLG
jgi:hypothetical protein